jgi:hypothetical protein
VIKTRRRHSLRRTRLATVALGAAAACIGALSLPVGATAAEVPVCGGGLELNDEIPGIDPPGGLSYKIRCNAQVLGFALLSNREVDYFGTEVLTLDPATGESTPEQLSCEGSFPSSGFGCRGVVNYGNTISGEFAIGRDPCEESKSKADRFKVWVSATVTEFDSVTNKPFTVVTQPFRIRRPDCPKASTGKKGKSKTGKATTRKESRR